MIRTKTYSLPIHLDELEQQPVYEREVVLRLLWQYNGFDQITFGMRGGSREPFSPQDNEVIHVFPSSGRWQSPAQERYGVNVRSQASSCTLPGARS